MKIRLLIEAIEAFFFLSLFAKKGERIKKERMQSIEREKKAVRLMVKGVVK
jgi:hypothetical protein